MLDQPLVTSFLKSWTRSTLQALHSWPSGSWYRFCFPDKDKAKQQLSVFNYSIYRYDRPKRDKSFSCCFYLVFCWTLSSRWVCMVTERFKSCSRVNFGQAQYVRKVPKMPQKYLLCNWSTMRFGLEQLLLVLTSTATFATLASLFLSSSSSEHTTGHWRGRKSFVMSFKWVFGQ